MQIYLVTGQNPTSPGIRSNSPAYCVGVEVGPSLIRAAVLSREGLIVGKTKFSTKPERGPAGVITRIQKCILYAVDECDLELNDVGAIGIGVQGEVDEANGLVVVAPELAWRDVSLKLHLEDTVGLPVSVANTSNLGAFGIFVLEAKSAPTTLAAILLGPRITGGVIEAGRWRKLEPSEIDHSEGAMAELNILADLKRPEYSHFRGRDFRKAVRRGDEAVRHFALEIAFRAGNAAATLIKRSSPEMVVIGGGMMDEMREDILRSVREGAEARLGAPWPQSTSLLGSSLGDLASVAGAALWAFQSDSCRLKFTALAS